MTAKQAALKRAMDLLLVIGSAPIVLPLLAIIAGLVRLCLGKPILFRQIRPGKDGREFVMFKFRTMREARGPDGSSLSDAERLTRFGRALRASSLDELPELFNVLRGEMSLVGPRPLLVAYLPRYTKDQARRHNVRPGISGWAQVNGRNAVGWEERFKLDTWYVDHYSLGLDLKILVLTAKKVLLRSGISAPGEATMHEFNPLAPRDNAASTHSTGNFPS